MTRHKFDATSGLDLFLDAICNTFGGIVFISMLVVVLINTTSVSPVENKEKTTLREQKGFAKLTLEKKKLLEEIQQQEEVTKVFGDSSEISELLAKLKVEKATVTRLQQELAKLAQQLGKTKADIDQMSAKRKQRTAKEKELKSLEERLQLEIAKRTKQLTLPTEMSTTLSEQAFFLKDGRLVEVKKENVEIVTDGILPKPGVGIRAVKSNTSNIQADLGRYNPKTHYIAVALWEDSFTQWPIVQAALRRKGFSYRLLLLPKDGKVMAGGSAGKVQR